MPSVLVAQVVLLSEIVGNGDGTAGSAEPGVVGINSDTGLFETAHNHATITNTGEVLEPVEDNPAINSVFILDMAQVPINTDLVTFTFADADAAGATTWNHILRNATHDFDKGFADSRAGGISFPSGIGIHAAAGITFDLTQLRGQFGAANIKWLSTFAGHDRCAGCGCSPVSLHVILSNATAVVGSKSLPNVCADGGEEVLLEIPDTALYLTLATGAADGGICCDHGVFAEPVIASVPIPSGRRAITSPGNASACPPISGGPISVTLTQQGAGTQLIGVTERAFGPFGAAQVTAQNGGVVTTFAPTIADTETGSGFIKSWLLLGPYSQPGGATPGEDQLRLDYLTDGAAINELDVQPRAGDTVDTDFGGAAASTGLAVFTGGINPGEVPTWAQWIDNDDTLNYDEYYGGNVDNILMYAVCYLRVEAETTVDFCLGSDDSAQLLLDGAELFINNIGRGWGASETCLDTIAAILLEAGNHTVMVKVADGGGGHGLRLGIFDTGTTTPATGVSVCLDPTAAPCTFKPSGVQIAWNVSKDQLATGVSYAIDIDVGNASFSGNMASRVILGPSQYSLIDEPIERGPFANPAFTHGHNIGNPCPNTDITSPAPGVLEIAGAGVDIWTAGDQFMFAYREVTGNFSARVTVTDRQFAPASRWGKHGIHARQDCSPRSRYSFVHDQGEDLQDTTRYATRPTHGGADNFEVVPTAVAPDNHANTLRLDRCGSEFIGYVLDELGSFGGNPGDWVEIGRSTWRDPVPETIQLGLAVTSHQACDITTITFEDWELLPRCEAPVGGLTCVSADAGGVNLTWRQPPDFNPAPPIRILVDGTEVSQVAGTATSATIPGDRFTPGQFSTISVVNFSGVAANCSYPPGITTQAFVKDWLLLGPYRQGTAINAANPGEANIRLDHLTDGAAINEIDVEPKAGDTVDTDYAPGAARSISLMAAAGGNPNNINPNNVPTWYAWRDTDDTIDFNNYYGGDVNQIMMYAVTYICVTEDVTVNVCLGSDDAVQVLLDGVEIHINNIARGWGAANECQDTIPDVLLSGPTGGATTARHKLMLKVFEGGGGHGFRLGFQDPVTLAPLLPGAITLEPECPTSSAPVEICNNQQDDDGDQAIDCDDSDCATDLVNCPPEAGFHRGDSNNDGKHNISDPVNTLNVLFLGTGSIACQDAADSNDDGKVNISDPVNSLNVLFLGTGAIPPPLPPEALLPCGPDPTDDGTDLGCTTYSHC